MELPKIMPAPINLLSVTNSDGPAFNTKSQTCQCLSADGFTLQPDVMPEISEVPDPTPKSLTADRLEALLQMQKTDPFCKRISKCFQMVNHLSMKQISLHMSEAYSTNTSLIQVRNSLHKLYLSLGNTLS